MRGTRRGAYNTRTAAGLIPTYAGNTAKALAPYRHGQGSSPRMRGTHR
ncbi:hypothetical protein RA11412_1582 [Rothia aeria]|uniref:Uncharacterized protein n=2 Tax=Rothia aeria TaxID=172042 RepID=A0A2Z5R013_9MICC|nr:hypothetical protein HMPREF1324_1146 [Rothia aeria F0474]BAV87881.1 hypothetical protein RA11412_1582 [Rothia aeria]